MRRGVSLTELVVVFGLFTLLGLLGYAAMARSADVYRRTWSRSSAQRELRKAEVRLDHDLRATSFEATNTSRGLLSLGTAPDSDALWMLNAFSPVKKRYLQGADGSPFWQSHILYYLAVPIGHTSCTGGAGPDGNDDRCPHKVLVRKVIDLPPATDPDDKDARGEELATSMDAHLTNPTGTDAGSLGGGSEVLDAQIVAINLLGFKVTRGASPKEVQVELRAVALEEAERKLKIGTDPLFSVPFTLVQQISIIPSDP